MKESKYDAEIKQLESEKAVISKKLAELKQSRAQE